MRKDGSIWCNLGDSYASTGRSDRKESPGVGAIQAMKKPGRDIRWKAGGGSNFSWTLPGGQKPKDLIGIPWRVALALQADGWWLRSDIIWSKPNPMPESVTDRPTRSHEYVFLLTKSSKYFYDADAVREPHARLWDESNAGSWAHIENQPKGSKAGHHSGPYPLPNPSGRNLRSVWHIATQPFPEAHFATFPQALVEPCIKAGTSEKGCCAECGSPWERVIETSYRNDTTKSGRPAEGNNVKGGQDQGAKVFASGVRTRRIDTTLGWQPTCNHNSDPIPCTVLDPFAGSGTVGVVCIKLGRSFVGIELKPDYCDMANKRVFNSGSLMAV